jgi:hypothetical protein
MNVLLKILIKAIWHIKHESLKAVDSPPLRSTYFRIFLCLFFSGKAFIACHFGKGGQTFGGGVMGCGLRQDAYSYTGTPISPPPPPEVIDWPDFRIIGSMPHRIHCFVHGSDFDHLCGLVVRVLGYRSGGPGSIPGTTRKIK